MIEDWTKAILNIVLATSTLVLVAFLWQSTAILIPLLIAVGFAMYFISPSKSGIVVYFIAFIFGPLAETIAMRAGAWYYVSPAILGFPFWLPFVWANTGLFIKNTADLSHIVNFKK